MYVNRWCVLNAAIFHVILWAHLSSTHTLHAIPYLGSLLCENRNIEKLFHSIEVEAECDNFKDITDKV